MSIGYEAFVKVECGICGEDVEVITTYDQMNEDKSKRFMISKVWCYKCFPNIQSKVTSNVTIN